MKINLLIGAILLNLIGLMANDIEEDSSYQQMGITYNEYILNGKNEECSITYIDNEKFDSTTCLSLNNSKKIEILCTKNKTICKTRKEIDDFVNSPDLNITTQISNILENWLKSHNNNDMKLLSSLYAENLTYYGKRLTRKKCIKDKKRALKKYPNFHQLLEEINYSEITPNIYKITFNKLVRLKKNGKLKVYPSYLLIDASTSLILVEGDEVTDKKNNTKKDVSTNSSNPLKETKIVPKIKEKQILDVSDVILDFKELKSNKICVKGDITAINDMVSLSDSAIESSSSIHLDVSNLNRKIRKEIMTKCGFMSDNCKEVTLCGLVTIISYSKGLIVDEIK